MKNSIKGIRTFTVNEQEYTLFFNMNTLVALEEETGMTVPQIANQMQEQEKISFKFLRSLLWAGLLKHHKVSVEEAGELLSEGELTEIIQQVGEAFSTSLMSREQLRQAEKEAKQGK